MFPVHAADADRIRRREKALLAIAFAFVVFGFAALALAPAVRNADWRWMATYGGYAAAATVWLLSAGGAHIAANRLAPHRDPFLLPLAFFLAGWGLVLVYRLAPPFGARQTVWIVAGSLLLVAVLIAPRDMRWLRRYPYLWLLSGLALTALTLVFGVNPSGVGPRLWLGCCGPRTPGGGLYLQPSELLKLLLVVYLAAFLAAKRGAIISQRTLGPFAIPTTFFLPLVLMWGFSLVLLISQRDLGTGSLLFGIFVAMLFLAVGRVEYAVAGAALLLIGASVAYGLFDVVRVRIDAWWNPWLDAGGDSFQIVQSLIALASGGLFGSGPGLGSPRLIPVVHSDFVFAAAVEEWGLAGGLVILGLALALVLRALRIAAFAGRRFEALLAGGLAAMLGLQTALIVGGVIKALPLTGVTLPFVSYGGSALATSFIALGLLLRLSDSGARGPQQP